MVEAMVVEVAVVTVLYSSRGSSGSGEGWW